jgi:hypothetical protein
MSTTSFRYLPPAAVRGFLAGGPAPRDLDPDHHLWKNGRLWWIAFTVHTPDWRKRRLRFSLRTPDIRVARARRDAVLHAYDGAPDCELSLRYARRTG